MADVSSSSKCVSLPSWNCPTCNRRFRSLAARDSHKVNCKLPKKQSDERHDDTPEELLDDQLVEPDVPPDDPKAKLEAEELVADEKLDAKTKEVNDLKIMMQATIDMLLTPAQARP